MMCWVKYKLGVQKITSMFLSPYKTMYFESRKAQKQVLVVWMTEKIYMAGKAVDLGDRNVKIMGKKKGISEKM